MNKLFSTIASSFSKYKKRLVYRSFWGRSNVYRNVLHVTFTLLSIGIFITGISTRIAGVTVRQSLNTADESLIGNIDVLPQGGSIQTILASNPQVYFKITEYKVVSGDTIDKIAERFGVSEDTLKWANSKVDYYSERIEVGDILQIPEINGVLYEVKEGDTLDSVISKTSGDRFTVIEVNQLEAPDFKLEKGRRILIPNGRLEAPPRPQVQVPIYAYVPREVGTIANLEGISFENPLSHPGCAGYGFSRGYAPWHNGVDLYRAGGCPIRSIADGEVIFAGWSTYGEGYNVRVYHGNGITSLYYHGDGNIWVKTGDRVLKGQDLMQMGCTGYCTGTHLHLSLKLNTSFIDPAPYVPY